MSKKDIEHRFKFHPADTDAKKARHEGIRGGALELAEEWDVLLPEGREKALAITKLEEAMFWANAAIARHLEY